MPELPEVETIRLALDKSLSQKKVLEVKVLKPRLIRGMSVDDFVDFLSGKVVLAVNRRAKLLLISFVGSKKTLQIHLKMTGQLIYVDGNDDEGRVYGGHPAPDFSSDLPGKYSYVIFDFEDGSRLFYNDMRQFGYFKLVSPTLQAEVMSSYGVEPLSDEFTIELWDELLDNGARRVLKAFLLDQSKVAGLGNIYVDEVCFASQVLPMRRLESLNGTERKSLLNSIRSILKKAVTLGGTTFRDYRDSQGNRGNYSDELKVYGRANKPCLRCSGIVEKVKLVGRGTHYCVGCQK